MAAYTGTGEVWRVVPSQPHFLVSTEGRVMVVPYLAAMPNGGLRHYGGQPHFGVWSKADSRFIVVYKQKTTKVHRLICEAFHGPKPFDGAVVMHMDENPANNRPSNLKWGTQQENLRAEGFRDYLNDRDLRRAIIARHDLSEGCRRSAAD